MQYSNNKVQSAYGKAQAHANIEEANPHRVIQMLMEGALEKIVMAKGFIERKQAAEAGSHISWAMSIIDGLRMSLDLEKGGEIAINLDKLYEFMNNHLVQANVKQDTAMLDEVLKVLLDIKSGWDGIEKEAKEILERNRQAKS